jgi:cytochrome c oxidase subunit II
MRSARWVLLAAMLATANVAAQEKVIQMTAEKFKFTPAVVELKVGQPVVLELTSLDRKHGFQVPDLKIDENIEPGRVTRVRIVPDKAGTFPFHCDVFCGSGHEEMAGEIVVKP